MTKPTGNNLAGELEASSIWIAWLVILTGLIFNLIFLELQPTVWLDEISYSDPAVNWAMGKGFISSAWYAQGDQAFWAGNVPLHQILLAGWLKIFGISEWAVRSFGCLVGCLAVAVFFHAGKKLALFADRFWILLALLLLLFADGISFTYRSGRSDALIMLLASLQLLVFTQPPSKRRTLFLLLTGVLAPWAGLQLVVYLVIVWGIAVCAGKGRFFRDAVSVGLGIAAGLAALAALYISQGTLQDFLSSVLRHSAAGVSGSWKGTEWLQEPFIDRSAFFLLTGALTLLGWGLWKRQKTIWVGALGCLGALLLIPLLMKAAGTYKLYYSWMALVPGILLLMASVKACEDRRVRAWVTALSVAAILVGLPLRLFFSNLVQSDKLNEEAALIIDRELKSTDRAISHSKFYYPVRAKAAQAYFPSYLERMTPEELASVQILILDPVQGPWPAGEKKENWKEVAGLSWSGPTGGPGFFQDLVKKYAAREINLPMDLVIYRRKEEMQK